VKKKRGEALREKPKTTQGESINLKHKKGLSTEENAPGVGATVGSNGAGGPLHGGT